MREDRNQFQIIRKDARNCFVESLNDSFSIGRIHLAFAAYDQSKPAGQRQTNNVHIYISVDEFLELCRKLDCGELRYMLQSKKKNGDNTPLYQCLGGTSAEKLRSIGRARPDGKSLSRVAQLVPANKADFLFVADSGPGETNEKGLIVPKFGNKPENHVAVMMSFESLSEMFLITRMHYHCWLTSCKMQINLHRSRDSTVKTTKKRTVRLFRCSNVVRAAGSKILAALLVYGLHFLQGS